MKTIDIQLQADENTINRFEEFCSDVGLNLSTAFNIFMCAVLKEKRIPFEIASESKLSQEREESLKNFYDMRAEAEKRGFLSDEEIEFEIQEAKKEIRERDKQKAKSAV